VYEASEGGVWTGRVYAHHHKKVLALRRSPHSWHELLSCSADGTVRRYDTRLPYANTRVDTRNLALPLDAVVAADGGDDEDGAHVNVFDDGEPDYVLPQAFGGGRASRYAPTEPSTASSSASSSATSSIALTESLLVDYKMDSGVPRRARLASSTLFSLDCHPLNRIFFSSLSCPYDWLLILF